MVYSPGVFTVYDAAEGRPSRKLAIASPAVVLTVCRVELRVALAVGEAAVGGRVGSASRPGGSRRPSSTSGCRSAASSSRSTSARCRRPNSARRDRCPGSRRCWPTGTTARSAGWCSTTGSRARPRRSRRRPGTTLTLPKWLMPYRNVTVVELFGIMIWLTAKKCTGRSSRLAPESEGIVPNGSLVRRCPAPSCTGGRTFRWSSSGWTTGDRS